MDDESLGQRMEIVRQRALQSGALQPLETSGTEITDGGITFAVRILSSLARKPKTPSTLASGKPRNPFLPYDPELFVADIGPEHVALLNKFNVVEHHLLIVTRAFEPQEGWLTVSDFAAWLTCLDAFPSLGFYNSGTVAGASQPHRHMQLVRLPLGPAGPAFPMEPRWQQAAPLAPPLYAAALPFRHGLVRLSENSDRKLSHRAAAVHERYCELLERLGVGSASDPAPQPHNLLLTRQWLFAVPRVAECFHSISLNAMAFAGALLVRDEGQLELLKQHGPFKALTAVAVTKE